MLVLTARNRTEERIAGLDAGADDYLGKPFELDEVEARLRALVRRANDAGDDLRVGNLLLDAGAAASSAQRRGAQPFDLPAREHAVLASS